MTLPSTDDIQMWRIDSEYLYHDFNYAKSKQHATEMMDYDLNEIGRERVTSIYFLEPHYKPKKSRVELHGYAVTRKLDDN